MLNGGRHHGPGRTYANRERLVEARISSAEIEDGAGHVETRSEGGESWLGGCRVMHVSGCYTEWIARTYDT